MVRIVCMNQVIGPYIWMIQFYMFKQGVFKKIKLTNSLKFSGKKCAKCFKLRVHGWCFKLRRARCECSIVWRSNWKVEKFDIQIGKLKSSTFKLESWKVPKFDIQKYAYQIHHSFSICSFYESKEVSRIEMFVCDHDQCWWLNSAIYLRLEWNWVFKACFRHFQSYLNR